MFGHAHRVGAVQWHWKKSSKWRFFSEEKQSIWELLLISVTLPIHGKTAAAAQQVSNRGKRLRGGGVWLSCVHDTFHSYLCTWYILHTRYIRVLDTYHAYSFKQGFNIACKCLFLHVRVKQVAFTISACIHTRGKTSTSATSTFLPYPTQWLVYTLAVRLPYPPP